MWFHLYPRSSYNNLDAIKGKVHIFVAGAFEVTGRLSVFSAGVKVGGWEWNEPQDISIGRMQEGFLPSVEDFATYGEVKIVFELTEAVALVATKKKSR